VSLSLEPIIEEVIGVASVSDVVKVMTVSSVSIQGDVRVFNDCWGPTANKSLRLSIRDDRDKKESLSRNVSIGTDDFLCSVVLVELVLFPWAVDFNGVVAS
jgi:hypothetical protein